MNTKRSRRKWTTRDLSPEGRESMLLSHNRYQQAKLNAVRIHAGVLEEAQRQHHRRLAEIEAEFEVERKTIIDLDRADASAVSA